jgi:chromosome segregation ATPase
VIFSMELIMSDQQDSPQETAPLDTADAESTQTESSAPLAEATDAPSRTVNAVAEAKRYRKRAQAAEKSLEEVRTDLAAREKTIAQHQQTIATLERRVAIDSALLEAKAIDLDAARLLAEAGMSNRTDADVKRIVSELRRCKPHLFRTPTRGVGAGALSPKPDNASLQGQAIDRAAADAVATGHRRDLLRYLRLRRQ